MDVENDPLADLAAAGAEIARTEERFAAGDSTLPAEVIRSRAAAERRRRGSEVWGILAVVAAAGIVGLDARRLIRSEWITGWVTPTEGVLLGAAVLFGTLGCRRIAGWKMAAWGRIVAWSASPIARMVATVVHPGSGYKDGDFVIALAGAMVWIALGLFVFAVVDALVRP